MKSSRMQRGEFSGLGVAETELFQPRFTSGAHFIFERLHAGVTGGDVLRAPLIPRPAGSGRRRPLHSIRRYETMLRDAE